MSDELLGHSLEELAGLIQRRQLSPVELTRAVLTQADAHNESLKAYIQIYHESALAEAARAETEIASGAYRGPLHGIPIGLKDNMNCRGRVTTMGSKIHRDFVPENDATVTVKLREAGAVLLGKLNMHEYALGGTTDNPWHGTCRNPWDLTKSPGGSSGGSAVAVATQMAMGTLGSDTSGSIRIPAAWCGVVGFKPTYGRVSKYGVFPEAWTLDHVGPITRTVTDAAIMFDAISGYDPRDPASLGLPPARTAQTLNGEVSHLVVGVVEDYFFTGVDAQVAERARAAIRALREAGAEVRSVRLPGLQHCDYALEVIDICESSTVHHANLRDRPQDYGDDVRLLLECGELPSAVEYLEAQQLRRRLRAEMFALLDEVDVLVGPTLSGRCPDIERRTDPPTPADDDREPTLMQLFGPASLLGLPCVSLPCGSVDGMPVGLQVIGPPEGEQQVLDTALAVEGLGLMQDQRPCAYLTGGR